MLISVLSQEQLCRQSPVPVLSAHKARAEGVKLPGRLVSAQPATTVGSIRLPESSTPAAFFGSPDVYSGIQIGSRKTIANLVIPNFF